jgi:hypothetical protein
MTDFKIKRWIRGGRWVELEPVRYMPLMVMDILRLIRNHGFISGGFARHYAVRNVEHYSDIDIFAISPDSFNVIVEKLTGFYGLPTSESPNAIQWERVRKTIDKITVIKPFLNSYMKTYGDIYEVLSQFDFGVCQVALYSDALNNGEPTLVASRRFVEEEPRKVLRINHINCPIAVAQRVARYVAKGYNIGIRELAKLFNEWMNRPWNYRERLMVLLRSGELNDSEFEELERLLRMD